VASILVIDSGSAPDAQVQRLRDDLSARSGHEVVFAATCEEALVCLEQAIPDLVVFPVFFSAAQEATIRTRLGANRDGDPMRILLVPLLASDTLERSHASARWFYWFKPRGEEAHLNGREVRALAENIRASLLESPVRAEAESAPGPASDPAPGAAPVVLLARAQPGAGTPAGHVELADEEQQWDLLEQPASPSQHAESPASGLAAGEVALVRDVESIPPVVDLPNPNVQSPLLPDSENASELREWADEVLGLSASDSIPRTSSAQPSRVELPPPRRLEAVPFKRTASVVDREPSDVMPTSALIYAGAGDRAAGSPKSSGVSFTASNPALPAQSDAEDGDSPTLVIEPDAMRRKLAWWRRPSRRAWMSGIAATVLIAAGAAYAGNIAAAARRFAAEPPSGIAELHSVPSGSEVWTGGRRIGVTPLDAPLAVGTHAIEFRYRNMTRAAQVTIAAETRTIHREDFKVTPVGELRVTSNPEGAAVTLDGEERGVTPLTIADVPIGRHALVFKAPGGTVQQTVVVEEGRTATAAASIFSGWVAIFSPFEVQVLEGRRELLFDDKQQAMLPPGRHTLRLVNETLGFTKSQTVDITPGEVTRVSIDLPQTTVTLTSVPPSEVWLDGVRIEQTPVAKLPVGVGAREFVFRHPIMGERRIVRIATTAALNIDVDLTQPGE
jgi:hypothetical protein